MARRIRRDRFINDAIVKAVLEATPGFVHSTELAARTGYKMRWHQQSIRKVAMRLIESGIPIRIQEDNYQLIRTTEELYEYSLEVQEKITELEAHFDLVAANFKTFKSERSQ